MPDLRTGCTPGADAAEASAADAFVLFGAMGDLAYKKIFPALYAMVHSGHLDMPIIGVARGERTSEHLKERAKSSVKEQLGTVDEATLKKLLGMLKYVGGDYNDEKTFQALH